MKTQTRLYAEHQIFSAAPLLFRAKEEGYYAQEALLTDAEKEDCARLGIVPRGVELLYSPLHYFGVECGDGWLPILLELSTSIEVELERMKASGVAVEELPHVAQIKQKFGEFRFSVRTKTHPNSVISEAIEAARARALVTCENCGSPGQLKTVGGCIAVTCDQCNLAGS